MALVDLADPVAFVDVGRDYEVKVMGFEPVVPEAAALDCLPVRVKSYSPCDCGVVSQRDQLKEFITNWYETTTQIYTNTNPKTSYEKLVFKTSFLCKYRKLCPIVNA
uniref:Uncharacterized protein n=1 Tax=Ceratitis capitata TaxID=7213 RepID=W8BQT5_CERCA